MWSLLVALVAAPLLSTALPQTSGQVETIQTTIGEVKGHIASWPESAGVSEYLGIPYAEPPINQLRFAAPRPYKGKGAIAGNKFSDGCIQGLDPNGQPRDLDDGVTGYGEGMGGIPNRTYSEDCLTLNIWSKPGSGEKNKAVLIWIYGGGNLATIPVARGLE